jgi:hypothetical protein
VLVGGADAVVSEGILMPRIHITHPRRGGLMLLQSIPPQRPVVILTVRIASPACEEGQFD